MLGTYLLCASDACQRPGLKGSSERAGWRQRAASFRLVGGASAAGAAAGGGAVLLVSRGQDLLAHIDGAEDRCGQDDTCSAQGKGLDW